MGLKKNEKIMFLRISDGKIRLKSDKNDPEAEERYTEIDGKYHYERVYSSCEGFIKGVKVQTHEEYGTTYNLLLLDPEDGSTFSLSISETSRYFQSFAMHFPNFDFSKKLVVTPYAFKNEGRNNIGISFKQDDQKIPNYYREVVDPDSDPPVTEPCNGLEQFDFSIKDKEDLKIERLKQLKFLKKELKGHLVKLEEYLEKHPVPTTVHEEETDEKPEETTPEKSPKKTKGRKSTKNQKSPEKTKGRRSTKNQKPQKGNSVKKGTTRRKKSDEEELPY